MRTLRVVTVVALALGGLALVQDATATTTASTSKPTVKVVVRPVTSTGHARPGFTVTAERSGRVDCSEANPSPGAVSRNIEWCSPSVEDAVACWKAATARPRVLCMRDPRRAKLARIPRSGKFAATGLAPRRDRAPLVIRLRDGDHCSIRDGGTSSQLRSHPNWYVTYYCVHDGAVWAPLSAPHSGINESSATWTVRTAPASGQGKLVTRRVAKAWFVGTFRS